MNMTYKENEQTSFDAYETPEISVTDIQMEGILCESNETLDDYLGDW